MGDLSVATTSLGESEHLIQREQLPYGAEYAKTGRSTCKKCKDIIPQGHLRMSIRRPSLYFDGLQDNWHHYTCFWKAIKSNDINERSIRGVDWLKWEDQEKIRESIAKHMGNEASQASSQGAKSVIIFSQTKVEYAKSARGKCQGCHNLIDVGTMKYGWKSKFYHFECFCAISDEFKGEIASIQGYTELTEIDQAMLTDALQAIETSKRLKIDAELAEDLQDVENDTNGPPTKRVKIVKTPEELKKERLEKQARLIFELKSKFALLNRHQIGKLLEANSLDVPSGSNASDRCIEILCDAALFGRPGRCATCLTGQFVYSSSSKTYLCSGHITEWTKCTAVAKQPKRLPFGIPKELASEVPWILDESMPLNALTERTYDDKEEPIISPKRSMRGMVCNRLSLDGDLEDGNKKSRGYVDVGKSYIKNGTTVDAEFEYARFSHVCRDPEGQLYSAVLSHADMATGKNSYYKMQLLKNDTREQYWVFRSWGRIGTAQGGTKVEEFKVLHRAVESFHAVFRDRTANDWVDRKYFLKKAGYMNFIETDTSEVTNINGTILPGSKSTLAQPIIDIMKMIFDVNNMQAALKEYDIDTDKMPLGKLSKSQITRAYTVLQELLEMIEKHNRGRKDLILDASNRFYTLIPHSSALVLLDNEEIIKRKTSMLDSLMEITEAYDMMKGDGKEHENEERDPVDVHYEKLHCNMTVLDKTSAEYKLLVDYAKKTHGQTHQQLKVDIIDIIKLERNGEEKKFKKKLGNRMLLWHGSGTPNYGGILSQGLRIAPPEAPMSGYMFGKGVYFADMFSKSANYCRTHTGEGLLLLADVALGKLKEEPHSIGHSAKSMASNKTNSCMGIGNTIPDPSTFVHSDNGYLIPVGKPVARPNDGKKPIQLSLIYNEYIVYDVDQICLRYLVRCKFR